MDRINGICCFESHQNDNNIKVTTGLNRDFEFIKIVDASSCISSSVQVFDLTVSPFNGWSYAVTQPTVLLIIRLIDSPGENFSYYNTVKYSSLLLAKMPLAGNGFQHYWCFTE